MLDGYSHCGVNGMRSMATSSKESSIWDKALQEVLELWTGALHTWPSMTIDTVCSFTSKMSVMMSDMLAFRSWRLCRLLRQALSYVWPHRKRIGRREFRRVCGSYSRSRIGASTVLLAPSFGSFLFRKVSQKCMGYVRILLWGNGVFG
jgi:hypothetical protein